MWLGVRNGMLHVRHLAPINYCGRQLARWLGSAAPACHEKEDAIPHPAACKHSLQYDGWPDGRFGVRVGTWNLGSLTGMGG